MRCGENKQRQEKEAGSTMRGRHWKGSPELYAMFWVQSPDVSAKTPDPLSSNKIGAYPLPATSGILGSD